MYKLSIRSSVLLRTFILVLALLHNRYLLYPTTLCISSLSFALPSNHMSVNFTWDLGCSPQFTFCSGKTESSIRAGHRVSCAWVEPGHEHQHQKKLEKFHCCSTNPM
ncbi:uncharacterized protein BT62DRAFT_162588 [Guyanagaster necrorhizus]|uniref:Uncharacterized protein n=1 Tax=Guyanagaster necrorhizus TaxID=856835 RepID=A0A9P7VT14_9AGAR|nr:uncharacterized protein BT62DRAFT_162588 [Guyanagaster necrorhizus MCA 3950]KAG7445544.1 hypothetical protein BT62DRAFT_162588 [Guyanagaster necrorhizus MCA 3950]